MTLKNYCTTYILFVSISISVTVFAQDNSNYLYWSANHKLTVEDFGQKNKTVDADGQLSYVEFIWEYNVSRADFITRNFNRKVRNGMVKSKSWIDISTDVEVSLRFQQTLFNINEVYARQFRKDLREIRSKLTKNIELVDEMNDRITSALEKRRNQYIKETNSGFDTDAQQRWEKQIQEELEELAEYAYENW